MLKKSTNPQPNSTKYQPSKSLKRKRINFQETDLLSDVVLETLPDLNGDVFDTFNSEQQFVSCLPPGLSTSNSVQGTSSSNTVLPAVSSPFMTGDGNPIVLELPSNTDYSTEVAVGNSDTLSSFMLDNLSVFDGIFESSGITKCA